MTRVAVVVPAGGSGRRMGGVRKQFLELLGEPMLVRALRPFLARTDVEWVVVALPAEDAADPPAWLTSLDPRVRITAGGAERTDSVRAGLACVPPEATVVLVHDAARPLLPGDVVERVIRAAAGGVGVIPGVAVEDTLKEVDGERRVMRTVDRSRLWRAQTPQGFPSELLLEAHRRAQDAATGATDDAALVERIGGTVIVVDGSPENIKVTSAADVALAEAILKERGG